jgi:hypothetical protein
VIHPLEYELAIARHTDCQHQAAQQRVVAEAEKLASGDMPSVPFLRSVVSWLGSRVIHATLVRGEAV